mgnify:CR=1 FL=1
MQEERVYRPSSFSQPVCEEHFRRFDVDTDHEVPNGSAVFSVENAAVSVRIPRAFNIECLALLIAQFVHFLLLFIQQLLQVLLSSRVMFHTDCDGMFEKCFEGQHGVRIAKAVSNENDNFRALQSFRLFVHS